MDFNNFKQLFSNHRAKPLGQYKESSVLIPIYKEDDELFLIFEKRALTLRSQPGDICFPGGRVEFGEDKKAAAIRETVEELNVAIEDIEYYGAMDFFISPYGAIIYPFVAELKRYPSNPSSEEVDHIFKVPISYFINNSPIKHQIEVVPKIGEDFPFDLIQGGKGYNFAKGKMDQYFYKYNEYVIWGFTARIVKEFLDFIK
ncbi:CoA pyrophosphatase [Clostridium sp. C8-1-8]|uniref:NUDIX hydrolase n=1 Tax=Clostridium sp. C8-1-8 TaxID=2698831 RepID=UPI00136A4354|nr:CoA pyrophosphatase [Clostridium sp. C8-1-8]